MHLYRSAQPVLNYDYRQHFGGPLLGGFLGGLIGTGLATGLNRPRPVPPYYSVPYPYHPYQPYYTHQPYKPYKPYYPHKPYSYYGAGLGYLASPYGT